MTIEWSRRQLLDDLGDCLRKGGNYPGARRLVGLTARKHDPPWNYGISTADLRAELMQAAVLALQCVEALDREPERNHEEAATTERLLARLDDLKREYDEMVAEEERESREC